MGIYNFKQFELNEKLGVSKASLIFSELLESRIYQTFIEFYESADQSYDETDVIKYRTLKPYITDIDLYGEFPVVGFEIILQFNKLSPRKFDSKYKGFKIPVAIGGSASGFGHKNWKNYSKIVSPIKKVSEVGLIIQIGIEIDYNKSDFDLNKQKHDKELVDGIGATLYHELNHSFEHYKRVMRAPKRSEYRKPIYDRSFNTAITYAENNIWKFPKEIWGLWTRNFLFYTYISEFHELRANIQEMYYYLKKYPDKDLSKFLVYQKADYMEKFDGESFYEDLIFEISKNFDDWSKKWKKENNKLLAGSESPEDVADKLKDMWVSVYEQELEFQKVEKSSLPVNAFKKMNCLEFIEYWTRIFNQNGKYLKSKIYKIQFQLKNEGIF